MEAEVGLRSRDSVLAERYGPILVLTLNRPERLNAWTDELEDRYFALLDEADDDPGVRAVVLTGAGRGFCAGADFEALEAVEVRGTDVPRPQPRAYPLSFRKPLIAAINGAAAGLGLVEAAYCDIRFAAAGAKLTTSFARRGLVAEYGISWLLPRLIGPGAALDLLLSGRVIEAEEGQRLGLVNRVVDPGSLLEEAIAYAEGLATFSSPTSMAVIKRQVLDHLGVDLEQAVAESERLTAESFLRPDLGEGIASYLDDRPPAFPPLAARG